MGGIVATTSEPAKAPSGPLPQAGGEGTWFVAGTEELLEALREGAEEAGVSVSQVGASGVPAFKRDSVLILELPGALRPEVVNAAREAGAHAVVVLDEPTVAWFARAVRLGASDVIAGRPDPDRAKGLADRWSRKLRS